MRVVGMEQAALWEPVVAVAVGASHSGAVRAAAGAVALPADAGSVRRFRAKCAPADDAGHVWWLGAIDGALDGSGGYGRLRVGRGPNAVLTTAHRYSWTLANGPVPVGLVICHRCDEPLCVAAGDLEAATTAENNWDAVLRDRRGSVHDVRGTAARSRAIRSAVRAVLAAGCAGPAAIGAAARAAMAAGDPLRDQLSLFDVAGFVNPGHSA
jgi:HNH endonuclease